MKEGFLLLFYIAKIGLSEKKFQVETNKRLRCDLNVYKN